MAEKATVKKPPMSQKKRIVLLVLCSLFTLAISTGVIMLIAFSMITEGTYTFETDTPKESLVSLPESKAAVISCLEDLVAESKNDIHTFVNSRTSFEIVSFEYGGTDSEKSLAEFMVYNTTGNIDALYPADYNGSFGEAFDAHPTLDLKSAQCKKAECQQGVKNEDGTLTDTDFCFFKVAVQGVGVDETDSNVFTSFNMHYVPDVIDGIVAELSESFTVTSFEIVPQEFFLAAKSDRCMKKLLNYDIERNYRVTLDLEAKGDFAGATMSQLMFNCRVTENYEYTWAGISFTQESMSVAPGEEAPLSLLAVINDDSEYEISFESSDETICTIDDAGYVKGLKESRTPAVIRVKLTYLGEVYEAECNVYVKTAVKSIKISDGKMTLKKGETATVSASVQPADATVTDVIWVSENDSIATVKQTGEGAVITATGLGETTVIAVSADGYFRDSCKVTVK